MPCRDWGDDASRPIKRHGMTIDDFEAVLCGIFTEAEKRSASTGYKELSFLLSAVDWKEVGVKRKAVENWWADHKKADEVLRILEETAKRKEELKATALGKLTGEERAALGI
jgi:hypothetical protein